jgi:hypothetical protein
MQGTAVQPRSKKIRGFVYRRNYPAARTDYRLFQLHDRNVGTVGVVSVFGAVKDEPIYEAYIR